MGLIKAAIGAVGGTLADQWKDYYYCDAINENVLVVKGQKRGSDRSSNKKGESNVISSGSGIAVADGQCMIIVEQGKVVELCAEPGVFTYDSEMTPSVFTGDLKKGLKKSALDAWERFSFGGGVGRDQRIYYFNTKEILGNKYGTVNPIPFRIVINEQMGIDMDLSIRCNGEYSYKIVNPMLFYTNVCGNIDEDYSRERIESQLRTELLSALQPTFGSIGAKGIRYSEIVNHTTEMTEILNDTLSKKWGEERGLQVVSFGINSMTLPDDQRKRLEEMQQSVIYSNPNLAGGAVAAAQADAMRTAAANESGGGAMMGFMGMGMANMAGANSAQLFQQGQAQQAPSVGAAPAPAPAPAAAAPSPNAWTCKCGATAEGNFCPECGTKRPEEKKGWTCSCGALNKGKFCSECGAKKPAEAFLYKCDKCGWEPENPEKPPKFCPECGDLFDDNDKVAK